MPRYDFRCAADHTFVSWAARDERTMDCECGEAAQRQLALPTVRGPTVNPPASAPKSQRAVHVGEYLEAGEQLAYEHAKNEEMVGRTLPEPPLSQRAVKHANEMIAGKRAMPEGYTLPSTEEE